MHNYMSLITHKKLKNIVFQTIFYNDAIQIRNSKSEANRQNAKIECEGELETQEVSFIPREGFIQVFQLLVFQSSAGNHSVTICNFKNAQDLIDYRNKWDYLLTLNFGCNLDNEAYQICFMKSDVKFDNIADLQYDEMEDEEHPFVKYLEEDGISVEQLKP